MVTHDMTSKSISRARDERTTIERTVIHSKRVLDKWHANQENTRTREVEVVSEAVLGVGGADLH